MNSLEHSPMPVPGLPKAESVEDKVNVEGWMKSMRAQGITPEEVDDVALQRLITDSNWDESGMSAAVVSKLRTANWHYNQDLNKPKETLN